MKVKKSIIVMLIAIFSLVTVLMASCTVESKMPPEVDYQISVDGLDPIVHGETVALAPAVNGLEGITFSFSSDNEAVASVDANGVVTGLAAGSANITITAKGEKIDTLTANVKVTVTHAYGEYVYVTEPTMDLGGVAMRTCEYDGDIDYVTVPSLSDESWAIDEDACVAPTYFDEGVVVYVHSEFPAVGVPTECLEMPSFVGNTYTIAVMYGNSGNMSLYRLHDIKISEMNEDFSCLAECLDEEVDAVDEWGTGAILYDYNPLDNSLKVSMKGEEYIAHFDNESGFIITREVNHITVLLPTALENGKSTDYLDGKRREGDFAFAALNGGRDYFVEYLYDDGDKTTAYITDETVEFGAKLVAGDEEIRVADLAGFDFADVSSKYGLVIGQYGKKDGNWVALDGLQGLYEVGILIGDQITEGFSIAMNGIGGIVAYYDEVAVYEGVYELTQNADYIADVYLIDGSIYLKLEEDDNGFILKFATAQIVYNANGGELPAYNKQVNVNVASELDIPAKAGFEFVGWYADEELNEYVGDEIIVEEEGAIVNLYAKYLAIVTLTVNFSVDEGGEEPNVYQYGYVELVETRDLYSEFARVTDWKENYYNPELFYSFVALVYGGEVISIGDLVVSTDMEEITVEWEFAPPYAGSYYGVEVWSKASGNTSKYTLNINKAGEISGLVSGYLFDYSEEEQKIYWAKNQDAEEADGYFFFDENSGMIAGVYSSMKTDIGYDAYVLSRHNTAENFKFAAAYAIYTPATLGLDSNYLAHFFTAPTADGGTQEVLVFVNRIYAGITIKDVQGNEYTAANIKNAKTLIVYDAEENVVYTAATLADSFDNGNDKNNCRALDLYFGTYTKDGDEDIILDGIGGILYGNVAGTYALAENEDYTFDVYLDNNSEYYQLTIGDGYTYSAFDKVMVTVEFNTDVATTGVAVEAAELNMNVEAALPIVEDTDAHVFRGWYLDAEFETKLGDGGDAFVPTENTVLFGKFLEKVVIVINYNGGEDVSGDITVYGKGEITVVGTPKLAGNMFMGWFTSENFEEGTEWAAGEEIIADVEIFAKWQEAPAYYNTYGNSQVYGTQNLGGVSTTYSYSSDGAILNVSPDGTAVATAYPFRGNISVYYTNEDAGELIVKVAGSYSDAYFKGYIDKSNGLIVMNYTSYANEEEALASQLGQVYVLSPFEAGNVAQHIDSSYWNAGNTRVINYTVNENVYGILVHEGVVYFGVSFVDENEEPIAARDCYTAPYIRVVGENSDVVAELYHLKFDVTVNYGENSGIETVVYNAQDGEILTESNFKPNGLNAEEKAFDYWYLDDINVPYDFSTPITGEITINVAWKDVIAQYGDWKGWNFYGTNSGTANLSDSYSLSIDADGVISGKKFSGYHLVNTALTDGAVNVSNNTNNYYMYYNQEAGVLWSHYSGNATGVGTDTALYFLQSTFASATYSGKSWNGHYFGFVNIVYKDETSKTIMCYNDRIYVVTLPEGVSLEEARDSANLNVYSADGARIFAVKSGDGILFDDGLAGTYQNGDDVLVLDGYGNMTLNDAAFSYNKIGENVVSYVNEFYREIVLSGETFVDEIAYCTVSFNLGEVNGTVEDIVANKTSEIVLPGADGGALIFAGWFEDEDLTVAAGAEGANYTVNADCTLYAKWSSEAFSISTSNPYPWTYDADPATWTSGNKGMNSSKSTITIEANTSITVTFSYACSSEDSYRWDYLSINLNGTKQATAGGKTASLSDLTEYSVTLAAGDVLLLQYEKDSSAAGGEDKAIVKDLAINGVAVTEI